MTSKTNVITETYLPQSGNRKRIITKTSSFAQGDSPHGEEVAGHTAGMIGQGNAMAHGRYMADLNNVVVYRKDW